MTDLVPDVKGPKLSAFSRDNHDDIIFLRLLSSEEQYGSSSGPHGRVFEVKIGAKRYALKIFRFFSLEEIRPFVPYREHLLEDDIVRCHFDPFFAECRAFGRLLEERKDDLLAVRCYGYMYLSEEEERRIEQQFDIRDWNRAAEDEAQRLRAILKGLIPFKSPFGRKSFLKMRQTLEQLNKLGIYNMDIREGNYKGGRLFDFSVAITTPHLSFWKKLRSENDILDDMADDLGCFDSMARKATEEQKLISAEQKATQADWSKRLRLRPKL